MPQTPREAYERHVAALAAGDLDAVVAGYAEDAVLVDTSRIGQGHEHIRAVFAEVLASVGALQPTVSVLAQGAVIFASWQASPAEQPALVGADTFVVIDGLITAHTGYVAVGTPTTGLPAES